MLWYVPQYTACEKASGAASPAACSVEEAQHSVHDVQVSADSENTKTQQLCSILEHELFVHTAAGGLQKTFSLDV